jgi:hypothetical protein
MGTWSVTVHALPRWIAAFATAPLFQAARLSRAS